MLTLEAAECETAAGTAVVAAEEAMPVPKQRAEMAAAITTLGVLAAMWFLIFLATSRESGAGFLTRLPQTYEVSPLPHYRAAKACR